VSLLEVLGGRLGFFCFHCCFSPVGIDSEDLLVHIKSDNISKIKRNGSYKVYSHRLAFVDGQLEYQSV
jgi:putative NADPH-quinone reductase